MATDTTKIISAANELSANLTKGGIAAKTLGAEIANAFKAQDARIAALEVGGTSPPVIVPPPTGSTALTDATIQNTKGKSEAYPHGLPNHTDGWYGGKSEVQGTIPPAGYTGVTGWGNIYLEDGQANIAGQCVLQKFQTWVVTKAGVWTCVQDQTKAWQQLSGAHFAADFSGNASIPWTQTNNADLSTTVSSPPPNYNCHFFPGMRGTYAANTLAGCFVMVDSKVSAANMRLVTAIGADWWPAQTGGLPPGQDYNPGVGQCNWIKLITGFRRSYFYSMSNSAFQANLPPPLR